MQSNDRSRNGHPTVKRFAPLDAVVMILFAAMAVAFIPAMRASAPSTVVVREDDKVLARYPIDRDVTFTVTGREGPLDISIKNRGVAVTNATCKNQVCLLTGRIYKPFRQIICAPNHVIVEITSSHPADSIDAIVQ
jgi:hypothetical protein